MIVNQVTLGALPLKKGNESQFDNSVSKKVLNWESGTVINN